MSWVPERLESLGPARAEISQPFSLPAMDVCGLRKEGWKAATVMVTNDLVQNLTSTCSLAARRRVCEVDGDVVRVLADDAGNATDWSIDSARSAALSDGWVPWR